MNNKWLLLSLICIVIIATAFITNIIISPKSKEDVLIEKINKLELKIDSLNNKKDSLRIVIDSTHVKIINNENHYKEVVNTILSNSDSANDAWSKQYIDNYRKRLLNGQ